MRYSEGTIGRVFILRLEDGEVLNDTIEAFARRKGISRATVLFLGGSTHGSRVVVGPAAGGSGADDAADAAGASDGSRAAGAAGADDADDAAGAAGADDAAPEAIVPLVHELAGHREVLALGTLIPNEAGAPVLHMHAATGREGDATVGCTRAGLRVWLVGEVVVQEIVGASAERRLEPDTGFELLHIPEDDA